MDVACTKVLYKHLVRREEPADAVPTYPERWVQTSSDPARSAIVVGIAALFSAPSSDKANAAVAIIGGLRPQKGREAQKEEPRQLFAEDHTLVHYPHRFRKALELEVAIRPHDAGLIITRLKGRSVYMRG